LSHLDPTTSACLTANSAATDTVLSRSTVSDSKAPDRLPASTLRTVAIRHYTRSREADRGSAGGVRDLREDGLTHDSNPAGGSEWPELVQVIQRGTDLAGPAAGAAMGFVAGGPGGAALGAAAGVLLTDLGQVAANLSRRFAGQSEEERIGAAGAYAVESIASRILAGDQLRADAPWRERAGRGRTPAEEVFDGVLRAAADAWEQRKVKHLGLFFASLAFRPDISPMYGNTLLRMAESMGYRQFQLMAFFRRNSGDPRLGQIDRERGVRDRRLADGLSYELDGLGDYGVLGVSDGLATVRVAAITAGGSSLTQHDYHSMALTSQGRDLHDLLRLETIEDSELDELWNLLETTSDNATSMMQYKIWSKTAQVARDAPESPPNS
jgi:hypothetical protein